MSPPRKRGCGFTFGVQQGGEYLSGGLEVEAFSRGVIVVASEVSDLWGCQGEEVGLEFVAAPYPAWTAIGVSELITEGTIVEIRLIARRGR